MAFDIFYIRRKTAMKKFLALTLALAMMFALVACSTSGDNGSTATPPAGSDAHPAPAIPTTQTAAAEEPLTSPLTYRPNPLLSTQLSTPLLTVRLC
jgi:ABC-type glycerol-3-phosphate transport system substrate-binding protein